MKRKILRNMITSGLVTALLFSALVVIGFGAFFSQDTQREFTNELALVAAALESCDDRTEYLNRLIPSGFPGRLTLIAPDGAVLFDSRSDAASMENHLEREEVAEALSTGKGSSYRYSDTFLEKTYYVAARLSDGSCIRIAGTRISALKMLENQIWWLFAGLILVCSTVAFAANRMTVRIIQPINELDINSPGANDVYPELLPLVQRLQRQSLSIQEYIRELNTRRVEFDAITAGMAEALAMFDTDGKVVYMNRSALRLFGMEDALGKNALTLSRSKEFNAVIRTALRERSSEALLEEDGRFYQLTANPVFDSGHFIGIVLLAPDVTDRHLAEINRREFTANISHELKTPLTSIMGYAEIMENGIAAPEDMHGFSALIHKEAARLMRLVEDILHLSRLDSGAPYTDREVVSLPELIQEITSRFEAPASARNVSIHCELSDAQVSGLPQILDEMISNLIDNAIKYNNPGGRVDVVLHRTRTLAVITVADTGIGIAPGDQPRVFERFFRVDKSRSKETGGTGLGLSIVKHAAAMHNGSVEIESAPGEGTRMTVKLPLWHKAPPFTKQ